jgi:hypothetical protein
LHLPWGLFFAWLIVGGLFSLSVITIASIGLFVLPAALVAMVSLYVSRIPGGGFRDSWQDSECPPSLLHT